MAGAIRDRPAGLGDLREQVARFGLGIRPPLARSSGVPSRVKHRLVCSLAPMGSRGDTSGSG